MYSILRYLKFTTWVVNCIFPTFQLRLSNNSLTEIRFQMLDWSSLKMLDLKDNSLECTCDLYNISKALNPIVTKNMDGPVCIDFSNGQSTLIYQLTEEVCNHKVRINRKNKVCIVFFEWYFLSISESFAVRGSTDWQKFVKSHHKFEADLSCCEIVFFN